MSAKTAMVQEKPKPKATLIRDEDVARGKVHGKTVKAAIKGDEELGDLFFYSIPDNLQIPNVVLENSAASCGIHGKWMPKKIGDSSAFKRATESLKRERMATSVPGDDTVAIKRTVFVREAPGHPRIRHIVLETRRNDEKPEYHVLGKVTFQPDENATNPSEPILKFACETRDISEMEEFDRMNEKVRELYEHYKAHYTDRDVRNIMGRAMSGLNAIALRNSGAVFFCPLESRPTLVKLITFLEGIECEMFAVPLTNAKNRQDQVGKKLVDAVDAEAESILRSLMELTRDNASISPSKYDELVNKYKRCVSLHERYENLLEVDLTKAELKLQKTFQILKGASSKVGGGK